jgi:alanine dehydrogenase
MKTLVLSEAEVKKVVSLKETITAVESAFKMKGQGKAQMPSKQYLFMEKYNGDLRTMPAYLEETEVATVKVVNSHPENRKHDLPTVMATIILVDPKTGSPVAIMGGTWITALRTGAAGAVAAKYLANPDPKTVGLIGAGTQAQTQLMGLQTVFDTIQQVKVWDINPKASKNYVKKMEEQYPELELVSVDKSKKATQEKDIIVTTTPSRKPLVFADWVASGTHINCIGADAPGKQELDPNILLKSKIVVDDWEQGSHGGEINVPLSKGVITKDNIWGDICEIVAGLKQGRKSTEEITVFTSTGLAIQDAATANVAYQKALKENVGKEIDLLNL